MLKVNGERLWKTLMDLGEIGKGQDDEVTRISLSNEDMLARDYIVSLMQEAGLEVRIDPVGNIIGTLKGTQQDLPAVMTGSHIDTVERGGKFDGSLGVLAAIEAARIIRESGIELSHSIEVISFTDEEGTRFGSGFIGSLAMAGQLTDGHLQLIDKGGLTYREVLQEAGFNTERYTEASRSPSESKAYLELHIEQGRVLESEGLSVGIVTDIQGPVWMDVSLKGQADHAGTTPMSIRKDSSLAMAEILLSIEQIALRWNGVATVGKMQFRPGGANIIPDEIIFTVDFRHVDKETREKMKEDILISIRKSAEKRDLSFYTEIKEEVDPVSCSANVINVIEKACSQSNIPIHMMRCGAGHDAIPMSSLTEIGMIFVRSKEGISHNPREWSSLEDCKLGAQVLLNALIELAK